MHYNALIKSKDWRYEKEWRYLLLYNGAEIEIRFLPVPKPKSIYLGAKVSEKNREKILKIAEERDINVYQMEIKHSEFALESKVIYD